MKEPGVDTFSISRGMVGTMSHIRGVDIGVNFPETAQGVACQLQSFKYTSNPTVIKYGSHAKASAATIKSKEEAMAMLSDQDAMMEVNL